MTTDNLYKTMIQDINISADDIGVPELGKIGPYYKYVKFPTYELERTIPINLYVDYPVKITEPIVLFDFQIPIWNSFVKYYQQTDAHPYFYGLKTIKGL